MRTTKKWLGKLAKKYEEEISRKNERVSDLEKRLDISNEEKKKLIAAAKEDLERLNNRKNEELRQVEEDYEARVEKLKEDNTTLGNERDKFFDDKTNDLKRNYEEHIREITNGFEERMREKDEAITDLAVEQRNTQALADDLNEEIARIKNKALTAGEQRILEESEMKIEENEERIEELTLENESAQERLSLKERVKLIFKKHGFTVVAVLTAIGTVIGVLLSNLKSGLAKVAKGVGNGLKELGKKLAGILPGMVGAIAKFLFDTAGEVIGFLAAHAWLLIVGLVIFVVESFKSKFAKNKK